MVQPRDVIVQTDVDSDQAVDKADPWQAERGETYGAPPATRQEEPIEVTAENGKALFVSSESRFKDDLQGHLAKTGELKGVDLSSFDLSGVDFSDSNLAGSTLGPRSEGARFDSTNLSGATFRDGHLSGNNLNFAKFSKTLFENVKFDGVVPIGADFQGATFSGGSLAGMDFFRYPLSGVTLNDVKLEQVNFSEADLSGATIKDCDLRYASFDYTNLTNATIENVQIGERAFSGDMRLNGAKIRNCDLRDVDMTGWTLKGAKFDSVDLRGAVIEADSAKALRDTQFSNCDLRETELVGDFSTVKFINCDLAGKDLSELNISRANFDGCDLSTVILPLDPDGSDETREQIETQSGIDWDKLSTHLQKLGQMSELDKTLAAEYMRRGDLLRKDGSNKDKTFAVSIVESFGIRTSLNP
ncbi:MAG: pentapeptide repeat-containing protein [Candidatus Obscuribacterales bacterium]|nr:pentapeptide repeat-containing protein [Candidatus Obscuribacterales bacterium]